MPTKQQSVQGQSGFIKQSMLNHRRPVLIALSVVCHIVYCGQTVEDRRMVCIEVEYECEADISIGTILTSAHHYPQTGAKIGGGDNLTSEFQPNVSDVATR